MARSRVRDVTEVSCFIKYLVFGFNVLFWLLGVLFIGVGLWAWSEKDAYNHVTEVTSITLDPALFVLVVGAIMFLIGFFGCIGALRENTCLLLTYCICIGFILTVQLGAGILLFVYKEQIKTKITEALRSAVVKYRDDADLQNLIDWVQADWLSCCGISSPNDWNENIYFNCSSPSRERCGVPFSCCKKTAQMTIINKQCGYDVRASTVSSSDRERRIYIIGCLKAGEQWLQRNLIPVAAVVVGEALVQILGICLAQNLRHDVQAQRDKWI